MPKENPSCEAQKQHVTMSKFAYNIIRNDSLTFTGKHNDSGFINHLIWSFKNDPFLFDASYQTEKTHEKVELKIRLNSTKSISPYEYLYASEAWKKVAAKNAAIIEFKRQSEFIRVLIESYAHSTFFEREQKYYWENYKSLKEKVEQHKVIEIINTNNERYTFKPYRLSNEYESAYNYILGFSKGQNSSSYIPASIRLSRIKIINTISTEDISDKEKTTLDSAIQSRGVEYLVGKPECIIVQLTPKGKNLYETIFNQRPMYIGKAEQLENGNTILEFNCTREQAKNYFVRFGAEAIVLKPSRLRKKLLDIHKDAHEAYLKQQEFQCESNSD